MHHLKRTTAAVASLAALTLLAACGGEDAAPGGGAAGAAGLDIDAEDFDADLVTAAQEDGALTVYTVQTREDIELVASAFEASFDIPVNIVRNETGNIVQAIESQQSAGAVEADVVTLAEPPTMTRWAEEGVTEFVEVPNSDDFLPGYYDPALGYVPILVQIGGIAYNTASAEPPTTWAEVAEGLDGTLALTDPNTSGTAATVLAQLADPLGEQWLDDTFANNETLVTDSAGSGIIQMVITGEADYAIPGIESLILTAKEQGEPIDVAYLDEGIMTATNETAKISEAPHAAAAELFVQFQVHPDIQAAFVDNNGVRSVLSNVEPPEGGEDVSDSALLELPATEMEERRDRIRELWNSLN
jgi:iron(III) transport system substrate-binding protein